MGSYQSMIKSKIFGLLCEFEKEGNWSKFYDTIYIELLGIAEERRGERYYELCAKFSALRFLKYEYFRKTIFDCIGMVDNAIL